eukprot:IDg2350t1
MRTTMAFLFCSTQISAAVPLGLSQAVRLGSGRLPLLLTSPVALSQSIFSKVPSPVQSPFSLTMCADLLASCRERTLAYLDNQALPHTFWEIGVVTAFKEEPDYVHYLKQFSLRTLPYDMAADIWRNSQQTSGMFPQENCGRSSVLLLRTIEFFSYNVSKFTTLMAFQMCMRSCNDDKDDRRVKEFQCFELVMRCASLAAGIVTRVNRDP